MWDKFTLPSNSEHLFPTNPRSVMGIQYSIQCSYIVPYEYMFNLLNQRIIKSWSLSNIPPQDIKFTHFLHYFQHVIAETFACDNFTAWENYVYVGFTVKYKFGFLDGTIVKPHDENEEILSST